MRRKNPDRNVFESADGRVVHRWSELPGILLASAGSKEQLAAASGYSYNYVSLLLAEARRPTFDSGIDLLGAAGYEVVLRRKQ